MKRDTAYGKDVADDAVGFPGPDPPRRGRVGVRAVGVEVHLVVHPVGLEPVCPMRHEEGASSTAQHSTTQQNHHNTTNNTNTKPQVKEEWRRGKGGNEKTAVQSSERSRCHMSYGPQGSSLAETIRADRAQRWAAVIPITRDEARKAIDGDRGAAGGAGSGETPTVAFA